MPWLVRPQIVTPYGVGTADDYIPISDDPGRNSYYATADDTVTVDEATEYAFTAYRTDLTDGITVDDALAQDPATRARGGAEAVALADSTSVVARRVRAVTGTVPITDAPAIMKWLHHAVIFAPANGTVTHTVTPSAGTVEDGALFTPAAGHLLVAVAGGLASSTTPPGWTLGAATSGSGALCLWWRVATGTTDDQVVATHVYTNATLHVEFFEFPSAWALLQCVAAAHVAYNGGAGPVLTGLTSPDLVVATLGQASSTSSNPITWSAGTKLNGPVGGYGYILSSAFAESVAGSTWSSAATTGWPVQVERLVWAAAKVAAAGSTLYGPNSFWNKPIGGAWPVDPDSAAMIANMCTLSSGAYVTGSVLANSATYGIPTVYATVSDPLYSLTSTSAPIGAEPVSCYVPTTAVPNQNSPGHVTEQGRLVVFQPDGTEVDFDGFTRTAGVPTPASVGKCSGTVWGAGRDAWGTMPAKGVAGNGAGILSGVALAGGVITVAEMAAGVIPHALQINMPLGLVRNGGPFWPVARNTGFYAGTSYIPLGARIALDPAYDVAGSAFPAWKKTILTALQTYGAIVSDREGTAIRVHGQWTGVDADWTGLGVGIDVTLGDLPWSSCRVMALSLLSAGDPAWF